jgi:hypothetical protein
MKPEVTLRGSHFIQKDSGRAIADRVSRLAPG